MDVTERKVRTDQPPAPHQWTRAQYEQMIDAGIFGEDDRVELIEGEIVERSPQKSLHLTGVTLLADELREAYPRGFVVREEKPLAFDASAEPEPDIAVVEGKARDYRRKHPSTAILLVEMAETSLMQDRTQKARLYAQHGIGEYWILNVIDACLEVYRDPKGDTYGTKLTLEEGDTVTPPQASKAIRVADVLP